MFKKILVPLDGSELAEQALDLSINMAGCYGAELYLLEVHEDAMDVGEAATVRAIALATGSEAEALEVVQHQAEAYLRRLVKAYAEKTAVPMHIDAKWGSPADVIVSHAQENGVDLIVMATHGRTGLRRFALGSVTEDVLHKAKCPVMVIRPAAAHLR